MFYHTTKTRLESDIDKCFLTILIILQIGFEPQWMHYLKTYVAPIANYIFTGYYSEVRCVLHRGPVGTNNCVLLKPAAHESYPLS